MQKFAITLLFLFAGLFTAYSQTGAWTGDLEVQGIKIPLVFHLDDNNPTLDSPNQGAKGIPMQLSRPVTDSISVNIPIIGASFAGRLTGDRITGQFSQNGYKFPLNLHQGEKVTVRPQTPRPPFPYTQEEVSFSNGEATLKGTLTLPKGYDKNTPVVIMVTGSGLQNRDEELFEHKPFAVIADALARNGIASLRYDDRGFGESTGDVVNCTTEDLMLDALSGINLLRQRFNNVGVLGHSEGGTIALMLGADKKVDFAVSLAGMVVSGKETLLGQNRYLLSQAGYPQQVIDDYCDMLTLAFDNDGSLQNRLETATLPNELKQNIQQSLAQLNSKYLQYFLALDLRNKLASVECPVLALNGTKDTQVFHNENLDALNSGLPSNAKNRVMAIEGVNHLFQHCQTGSINEYGSIEETISPDVLGIICNWINDSAI